jgi:hypothetical protein
VKRARSKSERAKERRLRELFELWRRIVVCYFTRTRCTTRNICTYVILDDIIQETRGILRGTLCMCLCFKGAKLVYPAAATRAHFSPLAILWCAITTLSLTYLTAVQTRLKHSNHLSCAIHGQSRHLLGVC